jgi:hypothetical protein
MSRPSHPPSSHRHNNTHIEEYKLCSFSLNIFLHPLVTSPLLGLNILLSTLFSYILNLCSSLWVRDKISHPYENIESLSQTLILVSAWH